MKWSKVVTKSFRDEIVFIKASPKNKKKHKNLRKNWKLNYFYLCDPVTYLQVYNNNKHYPTLTSRKTAGIETWKRLWRSIFKKSHFYDLQQILYKIHFSSPSVIFIRHKFIIAHERVYIKNQTHHMLVRYTFRWEWEWCWSSSLIAFPSPIRWENRTSSCNFYWSSIVQ